MLIDLGYSAISFFERAKGSATALPEDDAEDISPLVCLAINSDATQIAVPKDV